MRPPPAPNSEARRAWAGLPQPGSWVRNTACPEWGVGQVQSVVGHRITVGFEHAGKVLIDARHVALEVVDP